MNNIMYIITDLDYYASSSRFFTQPTIYYATTGQE